MENTFPDITNEMSLNDFRTEEFVDWLTAGNHPDDQFTAGNDADDQFMSPVDISIFGELDLDRSLYEPTQSGVGGSDSGLLNASGLVMKSEDVTTPHGAEVVNAMPDVSTSFATGHPAILPQPELPTGEPIELASPLPTMSHQVKVESSSLLVPHLPLPEPDAATPVSSDDRACSPPSGGESEQAMTDLSLRQVEELTAAEAAKFVADRVRANRKLGAGSEGDEDSVKFPCPYNDCGKVFGRPSHLKKHLYIHTGERNYKCDVCNAAFKTQWTLTKHLRIHTGERPFSCDQCDMAFTQRGSWRRHIFSHHAKAVNASLRCEMHRCPKCPKCYKEQGNLAKHMMLAHKMAPRSIPSSKTETGRAGKGRKPVASFIQKCTILKDSPASLYGTRKTLS